MAEETKINSVNITDIADEGIRKILKGVADDVGNIDIPESLNSSSGSKYGVKIPESDEDKKLFKDWVEAKERLTMATDNEKVLKAKVLKYIGDFRGAKVGDILVKVSEVESSRFNKKAFEVEYPDVLSAYTKSSISKRLNIIK